jgi:uncharacterized protein (TIGR03083 family)
MHVWDAANAAGSPPPLDRELAADGIDEVAGVFYPRQVRLGRRPPLGAALALACTDVPAVTVLGEGEPVARLSGPAELLLLVLWRRRDAGDLLASGALELDGDVAACRAALGEQLTP